MIGGLSAVHNDVIPYGLATGNRAKLEGINLVGLKRSGYSSKDIKDLVKTVNAIFSSNSIQSKSIEYKNSKNELVNKLCTFIEDDSNRGLCPYAKK